MGVYWRDEYNQIQASFAYRIGRIALQYRDMGIAKGDKKYEVTLNICLLQSLITQCQELIRAMKKHEKRKTFFKATFANQESLWGLKESMIKQNTFQEKKLDYETIFNHIRNALSHPGMIDLRAEYPSTGFTTPNTQNREIEEVIFISSPDIRKNKLKQYKCREEVVNILKNMRNSTDVTIVEEPSNDGTNYFMWHEGGKFARIFQIDIPIASLNELVVNLSNHLALPTLEKWDGINVEDVIFA